MIFADMLQCLVPAAIVYIYSVRTSCIVNILAIIIMGSVKFRHTVNFDYFECDKFMTIKHCSYCECDYE